MPHALPGVGMSMPRRLRRVYDGDVTFDIHPR